MLITIGIVSLAALGLAGVAYRYAASIRRAQRVAARFARLKGD